MMHWKPSSELVFWGVEGQEFVKEDFMPALNQPEAGRLLLCKTRPDKSDSQSS